jgi:hypothetical protein
VSRARPAAVLGALVLPAALLAQQPYDAKVAQAMSATWIIDRERSEPVPDVAAPTAVVPRGNPADAVGGAPTGGGSSRRRSGSAPAPTSSGGGGLPPAGAGGGSGMRNPYVRELLTQLAAPELMTLTASDTAIVITVQGVEVSWTPDGRKHQQAMIDGTLLHNTARWKGSKVELIDGVEGTAELKREIHLIDDGQALEVKLELGGPGVPRKLSRKVVYVRQ